MALSGVDCGLFSVGEEPGLTAAWLLLLLWLRPVANPRARGDRSGIQPDDVGDIGTTCSSVEPAEVNRGEAVSSGEAGSCSTGRMVAAATNAAAAAAVTVSPPAVPMWNDTARLSLGVPPLTAIAGAPLLDLGEGTGLEGDAAEAAADADIASRPCSHPPAAEASGFGSSSARLCPNLTSFSLNCLLSLQVPLLRCNDRWTG